VLQVYRDTPHEILKMKVPTTSSKVPL
jgi:hypothetical protein